MKVQLRWSVFLAVALLATAAGGCLRNEPLPAGRMDELHTLSGNVWVDAEATPLAFGATSLPSRLLVIREADLFTSASDLAGLGDRAFGGQAALRLLVSDRISDTVASVLRHMADTMRGWTERSEEYPQPSGREPWAEDTARILALVYRLEHGPAVADPRDSLSGEPFSVSSLAPVVRSLMSYAMERLGAEAYDDGELPAGGRGQSLMVEFILRAAFRLAGLRMPVDGPQRVVDVYTNGPPTARGVENVLRRELLDMRDAAEDDRRPASSKTLTLYLRSLPLALVNMARILEQWDKFYLAGVEIGHVVAEPGSASAEVRDVISLVLDVKPGQVVRMDAIHSMAPLLSIEGRTRINIWSEKIDGRHETHVQFVGERGGRIAVRFESWIYGLASLFTFPIKDWAVDEIVIARQEPERHRKETTVLLKMRLRKYQGDEDRRRLMRIHTVRQLEVTTKGERVDRIVRTDLEFSFMDPKRIWYYDRTSREALPRP